MKNRLFWIAALLLVMIALDYSGNAKGINLPVRPAKSNVDIVTALEHRRTTREYSLARQGRVATSPHVLVLASDLSKVPGRVQMQAQ